MDMPYAKRIQNRILRGAAIFALALMPTLAVAQELSDLKLNGDLNLKGYGSFFIDGVQHELEPPVGSGLSMINQMYVQYLLPKTQKGKEHTPIMFVHGCCLSSKSWQTTPDGRMGWDEYFARQGFDTYLADQVSRARSGFDATEYLKVRNGVPGAITPNILILNDRGSWNAFRWGETSCTASPCQDTTTPHAGIRFPMQTVGVGSGSTLSFYNQVIPDLLSTLPLSTSVNCVDGSCWPPIPSAPFNTPIAMAQLATQLDGAILVGHSESSPYPTKAALQAESGCAPYTTASACKVKGIIQIETGCYGNLTDDDIDTLKHIPILIVYGDYSSQPRPATTCQTEIQQITDAGGDIKYAWLPALVPGDLYPHSPGPIFGNEHMMMLDNNNLKIADILIGWINEHVEKKHGGHGGNDGHGGHGGHGWPPKPDNHHGH